MSTSDITSKPRLRYTGSGAVAGNFTSFARRFLAGSLRYPEPGSERGAWTVGYGHRFQPAVAMSVIEWRDDSDIEVTFTGSLQAPDLALSDTEAFQFDVYALQVAIERHQPPPMMWEVLTAAELRECLETLLDRSARAN